MQLPSYGGMEAGLAGSGAVGVLRKGELACEAARPAFKRRSKQKQSECEAVISGKSETQAEDAGMELQWTGGMAVSAVRTEDGT